MIRLRRIATKLRGLNLIGPVNLFSMQNKINTSQNVIHVNSPHHCVNWFSSHLIPSHLISSFTQKKYEHTFKIQTMATRIAAINQLFAMSDSGEAARVIAAHALIQSFLHHQRRLSHRVVSDSSSKTSNETTLKIRDRTNLASSTNNNITTPKERGRGAIAISPQATKIQLQQA